MNADRDRFLAPRDCEEGPEPCEVDGCSEPASIYDPDGALFESYVCEEHASWCQRPDGSWYDPEAEEEDDTPGWPTREQTAGVGAILLRAGGEA